MNTLMVYVRRDRRRHRRRRPQQDGGRLTDPRRRRRDRRRDDRRAARVRRGRQTATSRPTSASADRSFQFLVNHGSVLSNATISSSIAGFGSFRIVGGKAFGLFGNLLQPNGGNTAISISGDIGDRHQPRDNHPRSAGRCSKSAGSIQTGVEHRGCGRPQPSAGQRLRSRPAATISAHPLKKNRRGRLQQRHDHVCVSTATLIEHKFKHDERTRGPLACVHRFLPLAASQIPAAHFT